MSESTEKTPFYAWYALALLMVIYILNFLDRTIIYILLPLIKKEMEFSYLQTALISSTAFVIFYTVLGIPFGRLADKGSRKKIIAIGVAVWCLFSGLTAFSTGFWSIFLCRLMVGVGEATLGPAAISLLSDYFPPAKRATVTSIYSMGIAIGAGLAALLGGTLSQFGWRTAFMIVGFPGIILAVLVYFLVEPVRSQASVEDVGVAEGKWRTLLTNRTFVMLCLGYALFGLATNNLNIWGATFYLSVHKFDLATIGFWAGTLVLVAGIPATLFGGAAADWFRRRSPGGRLIYGSILSLVSTPVWLILIFTNSIPLIIASNVILLGAALGWLGAAAADATEIAGVKLRGLAIAVYFFSVNIGAYLVGSTLIGLLNDKLGAATDPGMMRYALLVCPAACLLGGIILLTAGMMRNREAR